MTKYTSLIAISLLFACFPCAQAQNVEGQVIAAQYGEFQVPGQSTGSFIFPAASCQVSGGGQNFAAFANGRPIKIVDSDPTKTEVATPSQVNTSACSVQMSTAYVHSPPYYLTSGTGGLQEAITATQTSNGINSIILNYQWYAQIQPRAAATVIASVQGITSLGLVDVTTTPYTNYTWNGTAYVAAGSGGGGAFLPIAGGTMYGTLYAPNVNGQIYPAACGLTPSPSWCSGTTADAWIRAACSQLPSRGGVINQLGLTGTLAAAITGCMSPTKQVIFLEDPTSPLTITEADGGITYPLDNGSMFLGPGKGQCQNAGGIHLAGSANVAAIVGPAHTDGTQESLDGEGLCLYGQTGATVSQALAYSKNNFANTTFDGNNIFECNTACIKVVNGSSQHISNNWLNVSDGNPNIVGVPLIVQGAGNGSGCNIISTLISGGQMEHALGGGPEISILGGGAGELACGITVSGVGIERNSTGTASTIGIKVQDCSGCRVENIITTGNSTGAADLINVSQSAAGRTQNVSLSNISNVFGIYPNTLNDTTPNGQVLTAFGTPQITEAYSNPGYLPPVNLPGTLLQSLGTDLMAGAGNFNTGSSTYGTNFGSTGCVSATGLTCTYTRTNSTAPAGSTYSQQIQITANTGGNSGYNGIQYGPTVSFTAGQTYIATFWGKGDGTFTGLPTFLLWNSVAGIQYCKYTAPSAFNTTWTLYSATCTPSVSGSSYLTVAAQTPIGATGTFYFANFQFSPVQPLTTGAILAATGPYGVGPATSTQTTTTVNAVPCVLGYACTVTAGPGGSTGQGQFNNAGALAGTAGVTFDSSGNLLTVRGKSVAGISYTDKYSGATFADRINQCEVDALALSNGNTSYVCSAQNETGSLSTTTPIVWGSANPTTTVTLLLPCNAVWSWTNTDGVTVGFTYYLGAAVIAPNCPQAGITNSMNMAAGAGSNLKYVFQTLTSTQPYAILGGFTVKNTTGTSPTSSGILMNVAGPMNDGSLFFNLNTYDTTDTYNVKMYNVSSDFTWSNSEFNAGNHGNGLLLFTDASGYVQSVTFQNDTFVHAGPGNYAVYGLDTRSSPTNKISGANFIAPYTETNPDGVTASFNFSGWGMANIFGFTEKCYSTTGNCTAPYAHVSNAYDTALMISGGWCGRGQNDFTLPCTVVVNDYDSVAAGTVVSDSNGHFDHYAPNSVPSRFGPITVASCTGCGGGGSTAISALTAATATNTVAVGNYPQVFTCQLTGSAAEACITWTEAAASTVSGNPVYLHQFQTLTGSTAIPVNITHSLNGSQTLPALSITGIWNTTGVGNGEIFMNVADTASGAGSLLLNLQHNSSIGITVDKAGNEVIGGKMTATSFQSTGANAEVVAFSATPTFSTAVSMSRIVLTNNITSFTLGAGVDGQPKRLCFQQGSGSYTVTPPANVHWGTYAVGTTSGKWNCVEIDYDITDAYWIGVPGTNQ